MPEHIDHSGAWAVYRYTKKAKITALDRCIIYICDDYKEAQRLMFNYPHKNVYLAPVSDERAAKPITSFAQKIIADDTARATRDCGIPAFPNVK